MQSAGIRAFVGKLSMDTSSRPSYVEESAEAALSSALSFVDRCRDQVAHLPPFHRLVEPVVTPRFVPTCSDRLLTGLGDLARDKSLLVQSHLAESHDQVEWVARERGVGDIKIFDRVRPHCLRSSDRSMTASQSQLLTSRTIQAHCTFLDDAGFELLASRGTAIAHCPLSNVYFSSQMFRLREALQHGVKVGLGSDIAGGYSIDIMDCMRQAVIVSRMRQSSALSFGVETKESLAIDWCEALYLATRGGAHALGVPHVRGFFELGASFDAQCSQYRSLILHLSNRHINKPSFTSQTLRRPGGPSGSWQP
jgi:guanine deaminase